MVQIFTIQDAVSKLLLILILYIIQFLLWNQFEIIKILKFIKY